MNAAKNRRAYKLAFCEHDHVSYGAPKAEVLVGEQHRPHNRVHELLLRRWNSEAEGETEKRGGGAQCGLKRKATQTQS